MKQNKQYEYNLSIEWTFVAITIGMLITFILTITNDKDIARLEKYDTCLTQAITVNPDPNDTTERSILLANCMDK